MFIDGKSADSSPVSRRTALRHLLVFQLKLAADALRDFLLSPLSIIAFAIDAAREPPVEKSLYLRVMLMGRRSDRMINLFDDHSDGGEFTIDRAVDDLESVLRGTDTGQDTPSWTAENGDSADPGDPDSSTAEGGARENEGEPRP